MGTFNNKIEAEFTPPKKWVLSRSLSYQNTDIDMSALELVGVNAKKGLLQIWLVHQKSYGMLLLPGM